MKEVWAAAEIVKLSIEREYVSEEVDLILLLKTHSLKSSGNWGVQSLLHCFYDLIQKRNVH